MTDITQILSEIESGDPSAANQLLPLVYRELRKLAAAKLANEKPGQTLQATALVHDAYIRLVDVEKAQHWDSRGHFFAAAAEAMRRILVENSRRKGRERHGAGRRRYSLQAVEASVQIGESLRSGGLSLQAVEASVRDPDTDVLAVDEALSKLAQTHPEKAELVKLRYFGGLTHRDAASALGIPIATADRHWRYARAWLAREMGRESSSGREEENS
jgi:RNA polymerase sigma factor (sigma-70 family)